MARIIHEVSKNLRSTVHTEYNCTLVVVVRDFRGLDFGGVDRY